MLLCRFFSLNPHIDINKFSGKFRCCFKYNLLFLFFHLFYRFIFCLFKFAYFRRMSWKLIIRKKKRFWKPIVYPLLNKYIHLLSTIPSSQVGRADVFERKNDEYFLTRIYYLITFKAFITLSQHDCRSLHFLR